LFDPHGKESIMIPHDPHHAMFGKNLSSMSLTCSMMDSAASSPPPNFEAPPSYFCGRILEGKGSSLLCRCKYYSGNGYLSNVHCV
jgi:hypothetical protein